MRKFEHETMYFCRACGHATVKEDFVRVDLIEDRDMRLCPFCGVLFDIGIGNTVLEIDEGKIVMAMVHLGEPDKKPEKKEPKK